MLIRVCLLHTHPQIAGEIIKIVENNSFKDDISVIFVIRYEYELEYFIRNNEFDILVITSDYIKSNHDGIYVARRAKIINRNPLIIFVSLYKKDNLLEIINSEPFAYITESRLQIDFCNILKKAISIINKDLFKFTYKKWSLEYNVSLKNVIYFTSSHRTIRYLCIDGREDSFYEKMDNLEDGITNRYSNYIRISQSYIINMKYILAINGNEIKMINGESLLITRKYHSNLEDIMKVIIE